MTARYYKKTTTDDGELHTIHKFETQTLSAMRMKLSDNNNSVAALSSSITMRSTGGELRDGRGEKVVFKIAYAITTPTPTQPSPLMVDLEFEPVTAPFQVNDGNIYFGATKADGFINMKYIAAGRCRGTVRVDGVNHAFSGQGMCLQQFQGIKPHASAKRWNCAYFVEQQPPAGRLARTLFMIELQCTDSYNGEVITYGFYYDGERLNTVTSASNEVKYAKTVVDRDTGYNVPEQFYYCWRGADFAGNAFSASCTDVPTARMARIDLFENVPLIIRKVLENFTNARPYIYQHFDQEVEMHIESGGDKETIVGRLFQEFSFLLEDPSGRASDASPVANGSK